MLFTSFEFMLLFLPLTVGMFFAFSAMRLARVAATWLALMSLVFYAWWSPAYLLLLMASIAVNYWAGRLLLAGRAGATRLRPRTILVGALVINLGALIYFKYANFFLESLNQGAGLALPALNVVLPLGISFFTFTQIAFLVDTYQGKVNEARFIPYVLFVTYFPHLIAGPVLHHAEMMPQFSRTETYQFSLENFLSGCMLFLIGLFKKIILADGIQPFVAPVFEADASYVLTGFEAWGGALAYTLQLYFDFSGYSDMAIGLARMINIRLPLNFNSPYKSASIIEFWRRWHMTLSRFLRDYLYIALGGNQQGLVYRYRNLLLTMLLGGLWHGAGWTFIVWGALHGGYLVINHGWQAFRGWLGWQGRGSLISMVATFITFLSVVIAWVFFRATSLDAAWRVVCAMSGVNGWVFPIEWHAAWPDFMPLPVFDDMTAFAGTRQTVWVAVLLTIIWSAPNSQQLMARWDGLTLQRGAQLGVLGAVIVALIFITALNASLGVSEFIYFNF